jgi:glycosyltransferase involved in cell wall biosynthesis
MRIVVDLQGGQATNRMRGIGAYSRSIARALLRYNGVHEIHVLLNHAFEGSIADIRQEFGKVLGRERVHVWYPPGPARYLDDENKRHRAAAELIREAAIARLRPDFLLVTSLFEGLVDDAVTSIGRLSKSIPTAVILYDLIPLIHRSPYLDNPLVENWYEEKLDQLRRADVLLSISESSRREAIEHLGMPQDRVVNISTAAGAEFRKLEAASLDDATARKKYGIHRPFVMYTGGIDHRKNIEGLIRAYAELPAELKSSHQLVVVCKIGNDDSKRLKNLARECGLGKNDLVLTGFVPGEDLVLLYKFVFPSYHEGFGLPVLEAMSCGKAVIGSDKTSIPEVIGRQDALFDPDDISSISGKIEDVLTDDVFRAELESHSLRQSKQFSWDLCAQRAIHAIEQAQAGKSPRPIDTESRGKRKKLAYVSPLPPDRSGISEYSAELLPELARYYDIDVVVPGTTDSDWINSNCRVRAPGWLVANHKQYDRVIYHFGNSHFHQHMFDLLDKVPGVVVLHDFYLSGIIAHMQSHGLSPNYWTRELYQSHGYRALAERAKKDNVSEIIWKYPCNGSVVESALGVIVHSAYSQRLAKKWIAGDDYSYWTVIPLLRVPAGNIDKAAARKALNIDPDAFLVCSFGLLGPTKLNDRLLEAWQASALANERHCQLVFVGENPEGPYGEEMLQAIQKANGASRIRITGWLESEVYKQYLAAADMAVQLRKLSRGESSAAVLDCMNYGLPAVVNDNGSIADLPDSVLSKLPDDFSVAELKHAIEQIWTDGRYREELGNRAKDRITATHSPAGCAGAYYAAIEGYYDKAVTGLDNLVDELFEQDAVGDDPGELKCVAVAISRSVKRRCRARQLLVDVSEIVRQDARTGIQRVVRSLLSEMLSHPPAGYRVEPVYATSEQGYRYAREYTLGFLGVESGALADAPVEYQEGDVFLGLDYQPHVVPAHEGFFRELRNKGVLVKFVVYDLLCLRMPQHFVAGASDTFEKWLEVIAEADGAVCISKSTADDLRHWMEERHPDRLVDYQIGWFHLGADLAGSVPTTGYPDDAKRVLSEMASRPSFLMVGLVEPRKGHAQVLESFEQLWKSGVDVNLVVVGRQGWMVEKLYERLASHDERGKRLFLLDKVSDQFLDDIYRACSCLIAASEGEGFGLPIIEASRHGLPLIARDIAVFREVAGDNAVYFDDENGLVGAIESWLSLRDSGQLPSSKQIQLLSWSDSTRKLLEELGYN